MEESKQLKQQRNDEIDLLELLQVLLQKLWLIILCFLIGASLAFGYTKIMVTPMYSASAQIYILTKTTSVTSLADLQLGSQISVDFATLAKTRPVIEMVIEELDLNYTYEQLAGMVTIENPADTRFLKLTAVNADPGLARDIANSLANATADRIEYIMTTDRPKTVEDAITPKRPVSPNIMKNTAMGALVGAFLAALVIVMQHLLNDTIQTEEDVRKYLNLHTLAAVPLEKRR